MENPQIQQQPHAVQIQYNYTPQFAFPACEFCGNDVYPSEGFFLSNNAVCWHRQGCFRCFGCHRLFDKNLRYSQFRMIVLCEGCNPRREILYDEWTAQKTANEVRKTRRVCFNTSGSSDSSSEFGENDEASKFTTENSLIAEGSKSCNKNLDLEAQREEPSVIEQMTQNLNVDDKIKDIPESEASLANSPEKNDEWELVPEQIQSFEKIIQDSNPLVEKSLNESKEKVSEHDAVANDRGETSLTSISNFGNTIVKLSGDAEDIAECCYTNTKMDASEEIPTGLKYNLGRRRSNSLIDLSMISQEKKDSLLEAYTNQVGSLYDEDLLDKSISFAGKDESQIADVEDARGEPPALTPSPFPQSSTPILDRNMEIIIDNRPPSAVPKKFWVDDHPQNEAEPSEQESFKDRIRRFNSAEKTENINARCSICKKLVYGNEFLRCLNQIFHRHCFNCVCCRARLNLHSYNDAGGMAYCRKCYRENVMSGSRLVPALSESISSTRNRTKSL